MILIILYSSPHFKITQVVFCGLLFSQLILSLENNPYFYSINIDYVFSFKYFAEGARCLKTVPFRTEINICCHIWAGASQPSRSNLKKWQASKRPFGCWIIISHYKTFLTDASYYIAISIWWANLYQDMVPIFYAYLWVSLIHTILPASI